VFEIITHSFLLVCVFEIIIHSSSLDLSLRCFDNRLLKDVFYDAFVIFTVK